MSVAGIDAEVIYKAIKHIHISVYPPDGRVRVAAPHRIDTEAVRLAVIQRLPWIRRQQTRLLNVPRQSERKMLSGESHFVWGERYLLDVSRTGRHRVEVGANTIWVIAPSNSDAESRRRILERWYRQQLAAALPPLLDKWPSIIGATPDKVEIRRMKTKWGSCTQSSRSIRFNLELVTKSPRCLEYVLVHELAHLLEPTHNARFIALMDQFMPNWRSIRDELNDGQLSYSIWGTALVDD